jgi:hypothetical protein
MELKYTVELLITLNEKEAQYLHDLTQNYLGQGEEDPEHKLIRCDLFDVTRPHPGTPSPIPPIR